MGFIGTILLLCFFIGLFNLFMKVLFGIGWCVWQLTKILGVIIIVLLILSAIGHCLQ